MIYLARAVALVAGCWFMFLGFDLYTAQFKPTAGDALTTLFIQLMGLAFITWAIVTRMGQDDDPDFYDFPVIQPGPEFADTEPMEHTKD